MLTRRNWLLRCSIIVNLAVLVYIATHIVVRNGPAEYIFDTVGGSRSLASTGDSAPVGPGAQAFTAAKPLQDQVRTFTLKSVELIANDVLPAVDDKVVYRTNVSDAINSDAVMNNELEEDEELTTVAAPVVYNEAVLEQSTLDHLKDLLKCRDKSFEPSTRQRGEFWVLYNFIRADHGPIGCHETVTYSTHGDFTFMDNLVPLLEKWMNPVSIAIHAPGTDLAATINSIRYLRDCTHSNLVKMYATFHVFFSTKHIPKQIPNMKKLLAESYNCSLPVPYRVDSNNLYKTQKKLLYPVNVGRNIARESALTHFVLASDIELYPCPKLAERFLNMIARNKPVLNTTNPKVFTLSIFEVEINQTVPLNKTDLVRLLHQGLAIPFHKKVCAGCHNVPKSKEWIQDNETQQLDVFHTGKRTGPFVHWEPIFIGTNADPMYDERLSWEGKSDKMTQGYALCVLDYDFMILNNAYLVHRPGIKTLTKDDRRARLAAKTNQLIRRIIFPELKVLYGVRKGCAV